jgi:hypothetical protein
MCSRLQYTELVDDEQFDPGLLDEEDPFEIDTQAAHLFKHLHLGIDDIDDVWAHSGDPSRCRPIGCYGASQALAVQYRKDRRR